jgi:hypothetical protein
MLQHILKEWRDRHFWLLLFLSLVVLFCVYQITLPSPIFINLGTEGDERYLRNFHLREQSELPLEIILGADAPRPEGQPLPQVALIANGAVLADFTMQNRLLAYQFLYHPPLFPLPRDLLLEIKSETFVPSGDASRALGIILNTVEVKPIISPFRLFQVSLLASLIGTLSIAFSYLLLRWLGVSQKKSLACGVIVLALLGFGIVKQFIVARFLLGAFGFLLVGYVLAILLEARGYRESLTAQLIRPWMTLKTWAGNLVSVIRNPYPQYVKLKRGLKSFWLRWRLDLLISVGLLIVAIAVRLPYLTLIPQITDEGSEVRMAIEVYRGELLPITGLGVFIGPLHQYLLALLFHIFGLNIYLPRLYVMVLGASTVVLTYWLTREMTGRTAGLVAASLMVTSPAHILINSHIAISNCTTPFFASLMLLVLYVAVQRNSGPLLVLSGVLAALSLQSHVTVLPMFPGVVVWFLWRRDLLKWLRSPWLYLAIVFTLLFYSNIIWFNAHGRLHSLAAAQRRPQFVDNLSRSLYLLNLQNFFLILLSMISGALKGPEPIWNFEFFAFVTYGFLLLVSVFYALKKGKGLPVAVLLSAALITPYFSKLHRPPFEDRYIAYLLPLCSVLVGALLAGMVTRAAQGQSVGASLLSLKGAIPHSSPSRWRVWLKGAPVFAAITVCLVLAVYPLGPLFAYYQADVENGSTNQLLLDIVMELRQMRGSDVPIYLDHELKHIRHTFGYIASKSLAYLLTLDGTHFKVIKVSETETSPVVTSKYGWWDYPSQVIRPSDPQLPSEAMLVLTQQSYLTLQQVFELSPVIPIESEVPRSQGSYGLYRLESRR